MISKLPSQKLLKTVAILLLETTAVKLLNSFGATELPVPHFQFNPICFVGASYDGRCSGEMWQQLKKHSIIKELC